VKLIFNFLACLLLVSCGFKLQEQAVDLTGKYFIVTSSIDQKTLTNELNNRLKLAGGVLYHATQATKQTIRIGLDNFYTEKKLLSSGKYGQGQVYIVSACLDLNLNNKTNKICARCRLSEDYNQQLSNINGLTQSITALEQQLVSLILLQIGSLHEK
jgi:outer membrane lipopolysaccharide assembly protein LptE/RlpB